MPGKIIENFAEVEALIRQCDYCVLSLCDGGQPYAVPMNAAYDGEYFYLHSGLKGRKLELLRKNPKVALTFVPSAEFVLRHERSACGASMDFASVCVSGLAEILEPSADPEAVRAGLSCLAEHFKVGRLPFNEQALALTGLIRVKAARITGKRNPAS